MGTERSQQPIRRLRRNAAARLLGVESSAVQMGRSGVTTPWPDIHRNAAARFLGVRPDEIDAAVTVFGSRTPPGLFLFMPELARYRLLVICGEEAYLLSARAHGKAKEEALVRTEE
jgi:hypothetical protein